jgi:hypothetical protein
MNGKPRKKIVQRNLLSILQAHIGRANAVGEKALTRLLRWSKSRLSKEVRDYRMVGVAICGDDKSGYFMGATAEELQDVLSGLRNQALNLIGMEAHLRGLSRAEVLAMLAHDLADREGFPIGIVRPAALGDRRSVMIYN